MNNSSYTSANGYPIKLLTDIELINSIINSKKILLRHLQLCPTNKCNQKCEFCSCSDRDKNLELSFKEVDKILVTAKKHGCKGITITGGGEPLLHPNIKEIVNRCHELGIKVGLVTNGLLLEKIPYNVAWCRVSFDPSRKLLPKFKKVILKNPHIDWSFSYVLYKTPHNLKDLVMLANELKVTHVRVVSDILNPSVNMMRMTKRLLKGIDKRVIYQDRSEPTRGTKKCLISLLKPIVGANGKVYPCCGIQYAVKNEPLDFHHDMGKDLEKIQNKQKYFNGSLCNVCYYNQYNEVLNLLMDDVEHKEWV